MGVENWKMIACDFRINRKDLGDLGKTQGTVCGQKFGKVKDLRTHKIKDHGVRFATEDQRDEALTEARRIVQEFLSDENLLVQIQFLDWYRRTTDQPRSSLEGRLRLFLDMPAVKELP